MNIEMNPMCMLGNRITSFVVEGRYMVVSKSLMLAISIHNVIDK